jgi:hypothetical protein
MKCLLIGGEHDGQWIDVSSEHDFIRIPCLSGFVADVQTAAEDNLKVQEYVRQTLTDATGRYVVFTCDMQPGHLIKRLLDGYRPVRASSPTAPANAAQAGDESGGRG